MSELAHNRHHHLKGTHEEREDAARLKEIMRQSRHDGFHLGAAFFGWLVSNSVAVLLITLLSALGGAFALTANTIDGQVASNAATISFGGAILLILVLGVAYYAGGYVAGRMSRFDGGRQGLGVWVVGIIMTILIAATGLLLGTGFNAWQQLNVPSIPLDGRDFTIGGLMTLIIIVVLTAIAAVLGGRAGERYYRRLDRAR